MKISLLTIVSVFIVVIILIGATVLYAQSGLTGYDSRLDLNENNKIDREDMHLAVDYYLDNIGETVGKTPTNTPEPTATSTEKPTSTPTSTSTPTETAIAIETPTNTPTLTSTPEPVSNCTHDERKWHPAGTVKCGGFGHEHGANPNTAPQDLLDVITNTLEYSISYPWETMHENQYKHNGYKWDISVQNTVDMSGYGYLFAQGRPPAGSPQAWALEFHATGGAIGAASRFHSYFGAVRVCNYTGDFFSETLTYGNKCGIVATGGHADFGMLQDDYKKSRCILPNDSPELDRSLHPEPYRGYQQNNPSLYVWTSDDVFGHNKILSYDFRAFDDWGQLHCTDPLTNDFIGGSNDHSLRHVYDININIPSELDKDGDGYTEDFNGFTDLDGNIDLDCNEPGPNCVPLIIKGSVPVGFSVWHDNDTPSTIQPVEYDKGHPEWIQFPN